MQGKLGWLLGLAALGAALGWGAPAAPAETGLRQVWAVDDGEKIRRDDVTSSLKPGPNNSVWDGTRVRLLGARNEVVAFQLILEADVSGAQSVNVTVSDLANSQAYIPGSHPLPPPESYLGVGVELFTEHYLDVTTSSWNDPVYGGFYWTAAANPHLTGWIPDALVPFSAVAGKGGAPFDIAADMNQGVWVDIYIPRGLPSGLYQGTTQVTVGGEVRAEIPLELEVLDFTLPDENHYRSMVFYSDYIIGPRYGLAAGSQARWDLVLKFHRMAHRHRIELIGAGTWEEIDKLGGTLSGEAFTASHGYAGPLEGVGNSVFSVNTYGVQFPDTEADYRAESDRWVNWFEANAPGVDYFLYLTDEPGPGGYDWIKTRAAWIHNNPGPGQRLPVLVTTAPHDSLVGAVDIWCTQAPWYEPTAAQAAEARGEQVWLYAGNRPQTPADEIDEYGIAFRLKPWIGHECGIPRWFTWESTHWEPNSNEQPNDVPKNVWVNPVTFTTGEPSGTGNGDGTLFYPGQDVIFRAQSRDYPGPISSIRMKMYRRGIQDVEYMWLAGQSGRGAEVSALLATLLPSVMWEAGEVPVWSNHNADYEAARQQLAEMIKPDPHFPDVGRDHWAFDEIEACVKAGIVTGYLDGSYQPDHVVTRDQMAVYMSRALAGGDAGVPINPAQVSFPDVPANHWAHRYIEYAHDQGIVQGYPDGSYQPALTVDRGQMAAYLARAIATPTGEAGVPDPGCTSPVFPDVACDFWARKYIQYLKAQGVTSGYLDGLYHPEYPVTRDQMAVYVARAFGLPM